MYTRTKKKPQPAQNHARKSRRADVSTVGRRSAECRIARRPHLRQADALIGPTVWRRCSQALVETGPRRFDALAQIRAAHFDAFRWVARRRTAGTFDAGALVLCALAIGILNAAAPVAGRTGRWRFARTSRRQIDAALDVLVAWRDVGR